MPDSRAAGARPQTLKSLRRSLNGEVANRMSTIRRASFSNFGALGGGVAVAEQQQVDLAGGIAVALDRRSAVLAAAPAARS